MNAFEVSPDSIIADENTLRALFPAQTALAVHKVQTTIDKYARAFIERSPFLCIGTQDREGRGDVSPRGDPPGFVTILDQHTLAIPDRPGNNRLDSLANILANPSVGLLFVIQYSQGALKVRRICQERLQLMIEAGLDIVVIDTAHGHSEGVINTIQRIRHNWPDLPIVAGNVVTAEGAAEQIPVVQFGDARKAVERLLPAPASHPGSRRWPKGPPGLLPRAERRSTAPKPRTSARSPRPAAAAWS